MTTARYYTPSGRSIQATGITPDVDVASDEKIKTACPR
jgi:carboxyl-terminal processing protease